MTLTSSNKGKGKVVARSGGLAAAVLAPADERPLCQQQQRAEPSLGGGKAIDAVVTITPAADGSSRSLPTLRANTAAVQLGGCAETPQPSSWRCTAFVQSDAQLPTLSAKQLGSSSSRQLLAHNSQPVLLPGLGLATCRLNPAVTDAAAATGAARISDISATSLLPAEKHPRAEQEEEEGGQPRQQQQLPLLDVLCSPAEANRFIMADMNKNAAGSFYHLRKPETFILQMSFSDWLHSWQAWQHSRLLLQADICTWQLVLRPQASSNSLAATAAVEAHSIRLCANKAVAPHLPLLLSSTYAVQQQVTEAAAVTATTQAAPQEVAALLDWPLLQQLLDDGFWSSNGRLQLLAGGRDALLPARYDTNDRLLCQVSGRQRLLLLPPDKAFAGLYPFPVAHPYDGYSCVDWENPELEAWPDADKVHGHVCELVPGDCLVVPAYWFVHSQLLQPACVSLVFELQPLPHKLASKGALLLQLSRMIEIWTAAEVGTANVRQCLQALAAGNEWQQFRGNASLTTVKGYKRLRLYNMILQQLQRVLSVQLQRPSHQPKPLAYRAQSAAAAADGSLQEACMHAAARGGCQCGSRLECEARQVLAAMCDERLVPTHWLNEGIADALYLQHPPQYFVIHEDAEAARYPQLFQHRLIGNRSDWVQHAERLALPPGCKQPTSCAAKLITPTEAASVPATGGIVDSEPQLLR